MRFVLFARSCELWADLKADLETKLTNSGRELEDIKTARAKDAQDLLANAKARLEALHTEVRGLLSVIN